MAMVGGVGDDGHEVVEQVARAQVEAAKARLRDDLDAEDRIAAELEIVLVAADAV